MEPQQPVFSVEPPGAPPPRRTPRPAGGFFGGLTALLLVIWKFGATFLSMGFMIAVYSGIFGWKLAAGIVLLIFVHEMGHVLAAVALGIPVSAPIFIPFVGAAIVMKQNPRDAISEAIMAYAGPLAGGVGSWACLLAGRAYDVPLLVVVGAFSFGINLFNLIPVPPLDGGRICAAVSRWFWVAGPAADHRGAIACWVRPGATSAHRGPRAVHERVPAHPATTCGTASRCGDYYKHRVSGVPLRWWRCFTWG